MGNGLKEGLWEDVVIFDKKTNKITAFITIETITCQICDRAATIEWNLKYAGLTEKQVYPDEFIGEMMDIKRKSAKRWKNRILKFYSDSTCTKGCSTLVHSGLNPDKIVKPHKIDYEIYKAGVYINKDSGICFILNEYYLNLAVIKKHKEYISSICNQYYNFKHQKEKTKFISFEGKGYFSANKISMNNQECLKIFKNLLKKGINTLSNRVII